MNRRNPIDDLFRSRLEDYSREAPMNLWDAIERSRDRKPRRRLLAIWLFASAALITTTIALLTYFVAKDATPVNIGSFPILMQPGNHLVADSGVSEKPDHINIEKVIPPVSVDAKAVKAPAPTSHTKLQHTSGKVIFRTEIQPTSEINEKAAPDSPPTALQEEQLNQRTTWITDALPLEKPDDLEYVDRDFLKKLFPPDPQCARFSPGYWYHYVDLTLTPGYAFRQLEALDSEYDGYLDQREKTEKPRYAFGAGVRLSAVSGIGLAGRAGINYTRITEAFDYLNENEVRITITNTYGPNGEVIRTDTSYVSGTRRKITPNQYHIIEVPLAIGYDLRRPKFDVLLSAGVRINLLFQQKGAFLSPDDLTPVNFSYNRSDAYPAFRKHLKTGWFVSAGLAYKWKQDFHFLFEPHLSYYPGSFTKSDFPVSQKYWLGGISIGVRKRL